jgi:hypothetical protein
MSIKIICDKIFNSIYDNTNRKFIDIIIRIDDYKCITFFNIIEYNSNILLSYNTKTYKYIDSYFLHRNSGTIYLYYDRYKISHITNLLIKLNFVINKLLKKIIDKMYSTIYKYNYKLVINDIKKINCMRLYKSFYYI